MTVNIKLKVVIAVLLILTINQNIPIDSVATATVTVRFEGGGAVGTAGADFQHVREELSSIDGVVKVSASYGK